AELFVIQEFCDLLAALHPTLAKVGRATGVERADGTLCCSLGLRIGQCRRNEDVDLIVVADNAEAVARPQRAHHLHRGLAGEGDLLAAHGAGAVDDYRDVERRALVPGIRRRHLDAQLRKAAAAALAPDELPVDLPLEVHVAPPFVSSSSSLRIFLAASSNRSTRRFMSRERGRRTCSSTSSASE